MSTQLQQAQQILHQEHFSYLIQEIKILQLEIIVVLQMVQTFQK